MPDEYRLVEDVLQKEERSDINALLLFMDHKFHGDGIIVIDPVIGPGWLHRHTSDGQYIISRCFLF